MAHRRGSLRLSATLLVVAIVVAGLGSALWMRRATDELRSVPLAGVLDPVPAGGSVNVLVVGSDSRAGADPSDPDFGSMGDEASVGGQRSDTIMLLRLGRTGAQVLSLPRDLYVPIAGTGSSSRINSAYGKGPDVLVRTVRESLGLPVHHYLDIDFQSFKALVDAVGGIDIAFPYPARDSNTGLNVPAGVNHLDGVAALAYVRSRYYEQLIDGRWKVDGRADLGRVERQQAFLQVLVPRLLSEGLAGPGAVRSVRDAVIADLRVDDSLDLRGLARLGVQARHLTDAPTSTFPATGKKVNGAAVLIPDRAAAAPVVAAFGGR